jgi:PAS domain S-box-containing protein
MLDPEAEGDRACMPRVERTASLASLQESETRYRLVMLATNDIIWDADLTTDTTLWSGAIEKILGYQDRTHIDDAWWQSSLHPDDRDRVTHSLSEAIGNPDESSWECEYRFRCRDGEYKTLFDRGLIIRDRDAVGVRMVGSMMDYTAQKHAEAVLVEARMQAEAAREAETRFLANISHELRTPLTSILGLGEVLLDGELDSQQRAFAETMHRSGQRLLAIINQFLDFSRLGAGFTLLEAESFDLSSLLEQLAAEFAPLAAQKGLRLTVERGETVPSTLVGDGLRVAQILQNLLGNAIKFTNQGYVDLRIAVHDNHTGPELLFTVTDSGVGFPADKEADLFKSFGQADESVTRKYGGTGLGLSICKQLAELMGGKIKAESHEGVGSAFTFVLPVAADR